MAASYIEIGYTKKTHGVDGGLKVDIQEQFLEDFLKASAVFLDLPGGKVPFFLDGIREAGALIANFEDVTTKEKATPLTGKPILLRPQDVSQKEKPVEDYSNFQFLKGFTLYDEEAGKIGQIEAIEAFPQQEMAVVKTEKGEKLIPLHTNLIKKIDTQAKEIHCILPEGLLEL